MLITLDKQSTPIDIDAMHSAEGYLVEDQDLIAATNTAIVLGKPILLTGEPGIGKTEYARWVAAQPEPHQLLKFVVKSTTESTDLFYLFDTLGRFREAQIESQRGLNMIRKRPKREKKGSQESLRFIHYQALGKAILYSLGRKEAQAQGFISPVMGKKEYEGFPKEPTRCVVLIDEIDKAPRDVPNDILDEIDNLSFRVPELNGIETEADRTLRPIVVITSNSERDLPRPFLRRCIYYHMQLPEDDNVLRRIAERRVGVRYKNNTTLLGDAIRLFRYLRDTVSLRNPPGLAELLDWLADMALKKPAAGNRLRDIPGACASLQHTLLTNPDDRAIAKREWEEWVDEIGD